MGGSSEDGVGFWEDEDLGGWGVVKMGVWVGIVDTV